MPLDSMKLVLNEDLSALNEDASHVLSLNERLTRYALYVSQLECSTKELGAQVETYMARQRGEPWAITELDKTVRASLTNAEMAKLIDLEEAILGIIFGADGEYAGGSWSSSTKAGMSRGPMEGMLSRDEAEMDANSKLLELQSRMESDYLARLAESSAAPSARQQPTTAIQTLLFSATWPIEVQLLAKGVLGQNVVTVEVGGAILQHGGRAGAHIEQRHTVCTEEEKLPTLITLLEERLGAASASAQPPRLLVFTASKRRCEELTRALRADGWPALGLHGDKSQEERDWVLHEFRTGAAPLLVATDVAQRGLDIKEIALVLNFDAPTSTEAYVHRIGRSGRAGAAGAAHTLLTPEEASGPVGQMLAST